MDYGVFQSLDWVDVDFDVMDGREHKFSRVSIPRLG